jgi:hypothetical protein
MFIISVQFILKKTRTKDRCTYFAELEIQSLSYTVRVLNSSNQLPCWRLGAGHLRPVVLWFFVHGPSWDASSFKRLAAVGSWRLSPSSLRGRGPVRTLSRQAAGRVVDTQLSLPILDKGEDKTRALMLLLFLKVTAQKSPQLGNVICPFS